MSPTTRSLLAAAALLPLLAASPATLEDTAVSYTFRSPVVNGMGLEKLEDLRGKPVFIEFWGTR